ncbi:hypothetical protein ACDH07_001871 [Salmonella enterica]|nr:hypothetical protein [Salmonella enterica subsp. enterica]ECI4697884.1 hypothetical protein [Salmonella enterica subsp. diarizonae]EJD3029070.1 hypothetical protein [Salmonella enterica]EKO1025132.1 hypothetical protein [Salmonella enterica subsp. enterica]ELK0299937.1 hypothetical protein [Salmonella enterica]
MKHVKNVFLVLAFALSAAAFSTSATAANDTKTSPKTDDIPHNPLPEMNELCKNLLEEGLVILPNMLKDCWGN